MTGFESDHFQKFNFADETLAKYLRSAESDLEIAGQADHPDVVFRFSYDALLKIGIALIASRGFRVRSRAGHHVKIIEKLSELLGNENVLVIGDRMRQARNLNLYQGGGHFSEKDSREYLDFVRKAFVLAREQIKEK